MIWTMDHLRHFLQSNGCDCEIFPLQPTTGRRFLIIFPKLPWWALVRKAWQKDIKRRLRLAVPRGWVLEYQYPEEGGYVEG